MCRIACLLFFVLLYLNAFGQETTPVQNLITDRPSYSEAPSIVGKGDFQIETGFNYQFDSDTISDNRSITYNTSLFRLGISKNLELRLIAEYLKNKTINHETHRTSELEGANPITVGTKILLKEGKGIIPAVTLQCYLTLPYVGKKEFRPEHLAPNLRLSAMNNLTEKLSLTCNVGGKWDGIKPDVTGFYTLNVGYVLRPKLGYFIELYGFVPEKVSPYHGVDSGLNWIINPNFQLDLSGGLGLTDNAPDGFFAFGMSYRIKNN